MDLKLVMFKPNGKRRDFPVTKPVVVIGRGENCDLRIPLGSVSRRHCEVTLSGDEIKAKDLASSNGTYVNNRRINECPLKAGDRLVVGPIVFTVQIDGIPEQITPLKRKPAEQPEEIVELEADVVAAAGGGDEEVDLLAAAEDEGEEIDPIAALEALAAEGRKKEQKPGK